MNNREFDLKLSELTLKHDEYVQRQEHWKFQRYIWVAGLSAAFMSLAITVAKYFL